MKKLLAMLLALAMAASLAACGGQAGTSEPPASESKPAEESAPASAEPAEPSAEPSAAADNAALEHYLKKANEVTVTDTGVTFTDDSGRGEMTVEKGPKNVAVLYASLTCLWYEAGGTAQVTIGGKGSIELYEEQIGRDITADEGVSLISGSSSGTTWDVEGILATKPDLIVCSTGMKGYETIGGPAEAAGIPVIGIDYDGVQDYLKWFKVFCNITGHPELWDTVAGATAEEIGSIVASVPTDVEPLTSISLVMSEGEMRAYTIASQTGVIVSELGGTNVVDPDNSQTAASLEVSLEDLYALDPDIIFITVRIDPETAKADLEAAVGDSPVWEELRAVKEGRVYYLEKGLFRNKANHRYDEAYLVIAQYLYPEHQF